MSGESVSSRSNRGLFEGLISALSIGGFFVLIGVIFVINQNLWSKIVAFANDLNAVQLGQTNAYLPAPMSPAAHTFVYSAAFQ